MTYAERETMAEIDGWPWWKRVPFKVAVIAGGLAWYYGLARYYGANATSAVAAPEPPMRREADL